MRMIASITLSFQTYMSHPYLDFTCFFFLGFGFCFSFWSCWNCFLNIELSLVLSPCNQKTLAWVHTQQYLLLKQCENRRNLTANFLRGIKSILNPSLDRSIDETQINRWMHYQDIGLLDPYFKSGALLSFSIDFFYSKHRLISLLSWKTQKN